MRLLYLVEEHYCVRTMTDALGERTRLLVANVARRRADKLGDRVLFHKLAHIHAHERIGIIKHKPRELLRKFSLPDAGRSEKEERTDGTIRVRDAHARALHGISNFLDCDVLTDDARFKRLLHTTKLRRLLLKHAHDRNTGPARDNHRDILLGHFLIQYATRLLQGLQTLQFYLQIFLQMRHLTIANFRDGTKIGGGLGIIRLYLQRFELGLGGANTGQHLLLIFPFELELAGFLFQVRNVLIDDLEAFFNLLAAISFQIFLERLSLDLETADLAVGLFKKRGLVLERDTQSRGSLINKVDGLVRQKTIADVARRKFDRGDDSAIGDAHAVEEFIFVAEPTKNGDAVLHRRFLYKNGLEATSECRILLDVFLVLLQGRRADDAYLAAAERGLQHIGRVQ